MKNKVKLLAVLATFALSAPVLAACGGGTPSKSAEAGNESAEPASSVVVDPSSEAPSSSSSGNPNPKRFYLDADCPETLVEDETYDLETFVVVEGADPKGFSVESKTPETAWIEGHTLEVVGSGDVSLVFTYGPFTLRYTGTAMSALAAAYKEAVAEVTNNYTLYQIGTDDNDNDVYMPWMVHNPRYVYMEGDIWQSSEAEFNEQVTGHTIDQCVGTGLIELSNGNVYGFNLYDDGEIDVFEKLGKGLSNYIIALDFNFPASAFTTLYSYKNPKTGNKHQALKVARTDGTYDFDAQEGIFRTNLINSLSMGGRSYVPHTAWLYPVTDAETGKTLWNMDLQLANKTTPTVAAPNAMSYWAFDFDEDGSMINPIESFIDSGWLPEAIPFNEIPSKFDTLIAGKNYTLTTEVAYAPQGHKDQETDKYDKENNFFNSYFTATTKVVGDSYYSEMNGNPWGAVYEKGGKVYEVEIDDEGALAEAKESTELTSLWGDSSLTCGHLGTGSDVYDAFEVSGKQETSTGNIYSVACDEAILFAANFCIQDGVLQRLNQFRKQYNTNYPDEEFFRYVDMNITVSASTIHVEFSISWDQDETGTYYYLYIDSEYSNIGTTTIPELDAYLNQA